MRMGTSILALALAATVGCREAPAPALLDDVGDVRPASDLASADAADAAAASDAPAPDARPADAGFTRPTDVVPADVGPIVPAALDADPAFRALFSPDVVHEFEVAFTAAEWAGLLDDMLRYEAQYGDMRTGNYRRATVRYRGPAGDQELAEVGFRTRGNTTRVLPQDADGAFHRAHFRMKFNELFDLSAETPEGEARRARRFAGLRALNLKWGNGDDPSQIREHYQYDLLHRAGVFAPRTGFARLTLVIDGTPVVFGLYTLVEPIDKEFLTRRFGAADDGGNLYKCLWQREGPATLEPVTNPRAIGVKDWTRNYRPSYDLETNEDTPDHTQLRDFIEQLNEQSGAALQAYLDRHFDVDRFLRWLALNVLVGMPDDYWAMGNNYYLYFGDGPAGVYVTFLPYDYDHGLGGGWAAEPAWDYAGIATASIWQWKNLNAAFTGRNVRHPLVDGILAIPAYRARYTGYLRAFLDPTAGLFAYADYLRRYEALAPVLAPALDNDLDEDEAMTNDPQTAWYFDLKTRSIETQLGL